MDMFFMGSKVFFAPVFLFSCLTVAKADYVSAMGPAALEAQHCLATQWFMQVATFDKYIWIKCICSLGGCI